MTTTAAASYCVDEACACHHGPIVELLSPCCPRCHRNGPVPLTIVPPQLPVTVDEMAARIVATRARHGDVLQAYHKIWYESEHTWTYTHFLGVGVMKGPNDLWMYQALLTAHRPAIVIETGTYAGGSALWFAYLMQMLGIDGHVYTIDRDDHRRCAHDRITFLAGDSTDPAIVAAILEDGEARGLADGPRLISLDADHAADHVGRELALYAPLCRVGDWLVVEDTNISWPDLDGGPRAAVAQYVEAHPGEWQQDILCERYLLSMNPGGWLQRAAACPHV